MCFMIIPGYHISLVVRLGFSLSKQSQTLDGLVLWDYFRKKTHITAEFCNTDLGIWNQFREGKTTPTAK